MKARNIWQPKKDQLPKDWSTILNPSRTWISPTAETSHSLVSRWLWLRHWSSDDMIGSGVAYDAAWPSGLVPSATVLLNTADSRYYLSLGGHWAMQHCVCQSPQCPGLAGGSLAALEGCKLMLSSCNADYCVPLFRVAGGGVSIGYTCRMSATRIWRGLFDLGLGTSAANRRI
jgi:hypothetical protein